MNSLSTHLAPFTILYGPTASGKTAQAWKWAQEYGAHLISFDSRHVYQHMDLVTGKDLPSDIKLEVPANLAEGGPVGQFGEQQFFWGVNLVEPSQEFSIAEFFRLAAPIFSWLRSTGKPLILVGGSWPYADVLVHPPQSLFVPPLPEQRHVWSAQTVSQLQTELQELSPTQWESLTESDRSNPRRLLRRLEIALFENTHGPLTPIQPLIPAEDWSLIVLEPEKTLQEQRIRERVSQRLQTGALAETQFLMDRYPVWDTPAFAATGYPELRAYLEGKQTLEDATQLWITRELQYAKRQRTWCRSLRERYTKNLRISPTQRP